MDTALHESNIRLSLAVGLGPVITRRLVTALGSPDAVCAASHTQLREIEGIGQKKADTIYRAIAEADVEREIETIQKHNTHLIAFDDENYPPLLRHIIDPPPLLYVRGEIQREDSLSLGVVGSRKCTHYGREQADRLAAFCSQAGLCIISGGARGIDSAAHRATVRVGGRTIAVLGSGLANFYPRENKDLFASIADGHGAVISEFPMTSPPIASHFPRRNRIISGLSLGVLVVEAATRSGALITARLAAEEHHREVLALPGRVDSPASEGCHRIVREGWAQLVTSPGDILDALGEAGQMLKTAMDDQPEQATSKNKSSSNTLAGNLKGDQKVIYEALNTEPIEVDALCRKTSLSIGVIQAELMRLQLAGWITRVPGNCVKRAR